MDQKMPPTSGRRIASLAALTAPGGRGPPRSHCMIPAKLIAKPWFSWRRIYLHSRGLLGFHVFEKIGAVLWRGEVLRDRVLVRGIRAVVGGAVGGDRLLDVRLNLRAEVLHPLLHLVPFRLGRVARHRVEEDLHAIGGRDA